MAGSTNILGAGILIVDDQESSISLLKLILNGSGFTSVSSTTDAREVCDLYRKHRYDLILLDLLMPGMYGFQVIEGLKEIEPDDTLRWAHVRTFPVRDSKQKIVQIAGIMEDITERKSVNQS
jgi:CheY-like chemotaxis protein